MNDSITTARKIACRPSCTDGASFSQREKHRQAQVTQNTQIWSSLSPDADDQGQYIFFFLSENEQRVKVTEDRWILPG